MYIYKDVYGRQVNVGDYVLAYVGADVYYGDCGWQSINGLSINHATIEQVGNEKVNLHKENGNIYCYKIDDINLLPYLNNFNYGSWYDSYNGSSVDVNEYISVHHQMLEILGRTLKPGDIVIYGLRKTKVRYGVVVDKKNVINDKGKLEKIKACYKVENYAICEEKALEQLKKAYDSYLSMQFSYKDISLDKCKFGDIILSADNKLMYICIGNLSYQFIYKGVMKSIESPLSAKYFIKLGTNRKVAKNIIEDIKSGKKINLSDVMQEVTSNRLDYYIKNRTNRLFTPYFDRDYLEYIVNDNPDYFSNTLKDVLSMNKEYFKTMLIDTLTQPVCFKYLGDKNFIYLLKSLQSDNWYASKPDYSYVENFNIYDDISSLVKQTFIRDYEIKKSKFKLLEHDALELKNVFSIKYYDVEMFIYFHK